MEENIQFLVEAGYSPKFRKVSNKEFPIEVELWSGPQDDWEGDFSATTLQEALNLAVKYVKNEQDEAWKHW